MVCWGLENAPHQFKAYANHSESGASQSASIYCEISKKFGFKHEKKLKSYELCNIYLPTQSEIESVKIET